MSSRFLTRQPLPALPLPRPVPRPPRLAGGLDRADLDQPPQSRRVRPLWLVSPNLPGLAPGADVHGDPWRVADAAPQAVRPEERLVLALALVALLALGAPRVSAAAGWLRLLNLLLALSACDFGRRVPFLV